MDFGKQLNKFQFVEQLISKGLTENKPLALKICVAESKEKGFGNCFPKPKLVGLFIPDLLKGKEPRRSKHIPKAPKMLVFTKEF